MRTRLRSAACPATEAICSSFDPQVQIPVQGRLSLPIQSPSLWLPSPNAYFIWGREEELVPGTLGDLAIRFFHSPKKVHIVPATHALSASHLYLHSIRLLPSPNVVFIWGGTGELVPGSIGDGVFVHLFLRIKSNTHPYPEGVQGSASSPIFNLQKRPLWGSEILKPISLIDTF
jgi:hypothetical protein